MGSDAQAFTQLRQQIRTQDERILQARDWERTTVPQMMDAFGPAKPVAGRVIQPILNALDELVKMATDECYQRRGIGRALMQAAIEWARQHRVRRLYLETNHTLTPAIRLYEASGFKHMPPQLTPYRRADVFMEMWLEITG